MILTDDEMNVAALAGLVDEALPPGGLGAAGDLSPPSHFEIARHGKKGSEVEKLVTRFVSSTAG